MHLPKIPNVVEFILVGTAFAFLVASIFLIKPFLYDVFIVVSTDQMRIKGGHPDFRKSVILANDGNVVVN